LGIIYRQAKMMLDAHLSGVPMDSLLMIGRQTLLLHRSELKALRSICPGALPNYQWGEYADRFFTECLKVTEVNTLDFSSYEGADILHDLNQPIPENLKGQFDVVVEAGSLEHVFHFPIAIQNLMQMPKVGGRIFASTVSNNLCGHGFYQFSPELIFRVFTEENGFELGRVLALEARYPSVELTPISKVFEVADPAHTGCRVGLMTQRPILLLFDARKTVASSVFAKFPMQSDYATAWNSTDSTASSRMPKWVRHLPLYSSVRIWLHKTTLVNWLVNWLTGQAQLKQFSLKNKHLFKKNQS
jgi:hypothetical protein